MEQRSNGGEMRQGADRAALNRITDIVIGCCIEVHQELGPGLLESIYEECLEIALRDAGLSCDRQGEVPVSFRGQILRLCYRYDMRVEGCVLLEIKAVEAILGVHQAQVLTYLKLTGLPIGLLCNFNVRLMKDGIRRLINPVFAEDLRVS